MSFNNSIFAVEIEKLWRIYHTGDVEIPALRGVDLRLKAGGFVAIKGRSGSGKTTLLNCIGGLDIPTSGVVRVFGDDIAHLREKERTLWRQQKIGFVFQSFGLLPTLSAYENVELMARIAQVKGRQRRELALHYLKLVGLEKWEDHRPFEMSGGQQQRVAIARALINHPQLILADEPTGELDSETAHEILRLFQKIVREEGVTLLMVSHDALVDGYADEILRLQDGQIDRS